MAKWFSVPTGMTPSAVPVPRTTSATALTVPASGSTTVSADEVQAVDFLATPSPNPFRGSAMIRFGLARAGQVRLELFDVAGRRIQTLANGAYAPGPHTVTWNGRDQHGNDVKTGIYFVRLMTPSKLFHARVVALH